MFPLFLPFQDSGAARETEYIDAQIEPTVTRSHRVLCTCWDLFMVLGKELRKQHGRCNLARSL